MNARTVLLIIISKDMYLVNLRRKKKKDSPSAKFANVDIRSLPVLKAKIEINPISDLKAQNVG
jgi:hypothetical protein